MKRCPKCKKLKSRNKFFKDKLAKDGLSSYCKICKIILIEKWQKENKEKFYSYLKKSSDKKREFYIEYKKTLKCQNCGENHPACLVFHHRNPAEKEFNIAMKAPNKSKEQLMNEIAKCDVLCANCHRKLHYNEKMSEMFTG